MDEKLNAMVGPHSPLPLPRMRNENQLEVDPVGIDAIIDAVVWLNPIAIDIAGIRLLGTKAAVKVNFLNAGRPKSLDGGAEPLQQPSTTGREPEALCYLVQRCSIITRRQRTGTRVKNRNQSSSILSETKQVVNIYAVSVHRRLKCHASAKARASGCRHSEDCGSYRHEDHHALRPSERCGHGRSARESPRGAGGHTSGHTRNAPTVGEMKAPAKLQ